MQNDKNYAADRLGIEPVGRLLLKFSLPAITGMIVQALYNMVDRVWVGRGVGETALAGLSLVMPLMTITFAFAMLFGVGSANLISIRLGQGRKDDAQNALDHCFWLLFLSATILMTVQLSFLKPLLSILGAQEGSGALVYAEKYYQIILYGTIFNQIGFGFSHCTRAQGFPTITMIGMFIGAGLNMVLDPIFIMALGLGVQGAAWATIISQLASMIWLLSFSMSKKAVIRLDLRKFSFKGQMVTKIAAYGSAQFLLQFIMSAVQLLVNMSIGWYGAAALGVANGGDIALSGMTIIGSVNQLFFMPIFGINQGAQPILGYNYGAQKYDRVRHAYRVAVLSASCVCTLGFLVLELFPLPIIHLFSPDASPALIQFAPTAMRYMMIFMPFAGFQIVSSNFFVVTGRPRMSIFLTTLRQCIAFIPCLLIFGRLWGLWGIVAAQPVADCFSLIITAIFIGFELKRLSKQIKEQKNVS